MGFQFPNPFRKKARVFETTPREVIERVRQLPDYQALLQATDQESADITAMSVLNYVVQADPTLRGNYASINRSQTFFAELLPSYLRIELQKVRASIQHLDGLLFKAYANIVTELRANPGLQMPLGEYGAHATDSETMRAAKWICRASGTVGRNPDQQTISFIQSTIETALRLEMDLRDPRTLEFLHTKIAGPVNQMSNKFRIPHRDTNYPGSGGGYYLQQFVGRQATEIREFMAQQPVDGVPDPGRVQPGNLPNFIFVPELSRRFNNYGNIACYLLGAHLRAHGFADGNGRAVRALYACAMIKSGHGFVAPDSPFEKQLSGL